MCSWTNICEHPIRQLVLVCLEPGASSVCPGIGGMRLATPGHGSRGSLHRNYVEAEQGGLGGVGGLGAICGPSRAIGGESRKTPPRVEGFVYGVGGDKCRGCKKIFTSRGNFSSALPMDHNYIEHDLLKTSPIFCLC